MDLQLTGKRVLVTGSTAGIGFAIACALAAEGAHVTLNGRSRSGVSAAVVRLIEAVPGARVDGVAADLSSAAGCEALTATCADVDILVNNLGIFDPRPFEEIQDIEWFNFFETNVMSGVRLSRHYLPAMKARDWGRIVFISSESGICPPAEMVHYGMSKSAQLSVARGMAETFGGTFEDMVLYVITILRDGPYREVIGPACGIMGEERDGLIVIFDVAATVTPDEVLTAARVLCGAGS